MDDTFIIDSDNETSESESNTDLTYEESLRCAPSKKWATKLSTFAWHKLEKYNHSCECEQHCY